MRFLPSPGQDNFYTECHRQSHILHLVLQHFHEQGGWTPELSKTVG